MELMKNATSKVKIKKLFYISLLVIILLLLDPDPHYKCGNADSCRSEKLKMKKTEALPVRLRVMGGSVLALRTRRQFLQMNSNQK